MDTRNAPNATSRGEPADDLSALAWVQDELRRTLEAAHKSLRRCLKESEAVGSSDVDTVDPSVLRSARTSIHQGAGALELVGLPEAALVLRASESLVQKFVAKPHKLTPLVVEAIEHASFALLDYRRAARPASPSRRWPCSRNTARFRKPPAPSASIRPTSGRPTGAGATSPAIPACRRVRSMPPRAPRWKATCWASCARRSPRWLRHE
ncbi:hypothetical protein FSC37_02795 [Piscinibacter aquaticus]|uniref:HPt domain-containing protein n=1 Tax=Piscinibacter aquaticus TaxID=392597 RepID=A0A5C6TXW7_9BURK|nr:hypothetical protein FSC37_02795 [Piscinibacter aquaticus]